MENIHCYVFSDYDDSKHFSSQIERPQAFVGLQFQLQKLPLQLIKKLRFQLCSNTKIMMKKTSQKNLPKSILNILDKPMKGSKP